MFGNKTEKVGDDVEEKEKEKSFDPQAFDRIFESSTDPNDRRPGRVTKNVPRTFADFVLDVSESPNEDCAALGEMKVTLASLNSAQELALARASNGNSAEFGMLMIRESIYAVNGRTLRNGKAEKEFFWDTIGPKARNVIVDNVQEFTAVDPETTKKAKETLRFR